MTFLHRTEIDGLRAIAVIPVIFFHAGFEIFSGGFVGVDVFFVISGYLICSILLKEIQAGNFSLIGFYERRLRRIVPALYLVIFTCIPFAWFFLTPIQLKDFGQSVVATTFFGSNILFWIESDYFATAAELKPLLHTWSLAVEEQFYLFFPMLLLLGIRRFAGQLLAVIFLLAIIGLFSAEWATSKYPEAAFFLSPFRAWELLIGAVLAFTSQAQLPSRVWNECASIAGFAMLFLAMALFSKTTPFPGYHALLPVVGTALVIQFSHHKTLVGRLLSCKVAVGVGLTSYSLYLWHQPLFAFARLNGVSESDHSIFLALTALSLVLAWLSWRYVESPFRSKDKISKSVLYLCFICSTLTLAGIGTTLHLKQGFPNRLNQASQALLNFKSYPKTHARTGWESCFHWPPHSEFKGFPEICHAALAEESNLVVWGDSMAWSLHGGLFRANESLKPVLLSAPACIPILDFESRFNPQCVKINRQIFERLADAEPTNIFLAAGWAEHHSQPNFSEQLAHTVDQLTKLQHRVFLVGMFPQWRPSLAESLFQQFEVPDDISLGQFLDQLPQKIPSPELKELRATDKLLMSVADQRSDTHFINILAELCSTDRCIAIVPDNNSQPEKTLLVWDYGHLTHPGSDLVASTVNKEIQKILGE